MSVMSYLPLGQVVWWWCAMLVLLGTPLSLMLVYRIRHWRVIVCIFSDLYRQPPPLLLFFLLWWVLLPIIINKAVRNQIASRRAALKLISRKKLTCHKSGRLLDMDHVVGQLLRSYPREKLDLLTMGAVDLGSVLYL